jgi:hypothetical protein
VRGRVRNIALGLLIAAAVVSVARALVPGAITDRVLPRVGPSAPSGLPTPDRSRPDLNGLYMPPRECWSGETIILEDGVFEYRFFSDAIPSPPPGGWPIVGAYTLNGDEITMHSKYDEFLGGQRRLARDLNGVRMLWQADRAREWSKEAAERGVKGRDLRSMEYDPYLLSIRVGPPDTAGSYKIRPPYAVLGREWPDGRAFEVQPVAVTSSAH